MNHVLPKNTPVLPAAQCEKLLRIYSDAAAAIAADDKTLSDVAKDLMEAARHLCDQHAQCGHDKMRVFGYQRPRTGIDGRYAGFSIARSGEAYAHDPQTRRYELVVSITVRLTPLVTVTLTPRGGADKVLPLRMRSAGLEAFAIALSQILLNDAEGA